MFGDDLNPSVTKARVGFGEVYGRTEEGVGGCREVRWFDKRETQTRLVPERSTKAKGFDELRKEREESGPVDLREGQPRHGRSGNYEKMQVL